ncbi:MAG: tetratricopeptide repeat protein, partial [Gammaproteobacteria bacterium]
MQPEEIESFLKSAQQKIASRQFESALSDLETFQSEQAFNPEAVYMMAVCHRYGGNYEKALKTLDTLKSHVPEHGRAHQEEGHTYRRMGKPDAALAAYERSTTLNPALTASWQAQAEIAAAAGLLAKAAYAEAQLKRYQDMPQVLLAVTDLIAQGKLLKAEDYCRQFLQKVPHHVEAMRLLALIGTKLGIYDDAELLLKGAVHLEPDNDQLRIEYIQALRKRQNYAAATEQARRLLEKDKNNPQFQSLFAVDCMQTGQFEEALDYFDRILETLPADALTLTSRGHAYKTLGNLQASIGSFHRAIQNNPDYGEA